MHHQKFLCIDNRRIMITGVDVNNERMGWLKPNMFVSFGRVSTCQQALYVRCTHSQIDSQHLATSRVQLQPLINDWHELSVVVPVGSDEHLADPSYRPHP